MLLEEESGAEKRGVKSRFEKAALAAPRWFLPICRLFFGVCLFPL